MDKKIFVFHVDHRTAVTIGYDEQRSRDRLSMYEPDGGWDKASVGILAHTSFQEQVVL